MNLLLPGNSKKKLCNKNTKSEQKRHHYGSLRPSCGILNTYEDIPIYTDIVFIKSAEPCRFNTLRSGRFQKRSGRFQKHARKHYSKQNSAHLVEWRRAHLPPADSKSAKGNVLLILLIWLSGAELTYQLQFSRQCCLIS